MTAHLNRAAHNVVGTPGTGTITLGTVPDGFLSALVAGAVDGGVYEWVAETADGLVFDIFYGTYRTAGPSVERTTSRITSNGGPGPLNLPADCVIYSTISSESLDIDTSASAAAAAASAAAALASELAAATSEANAATSETNAATSESNAATSESNASTSASTASSQASAASASASAASTSASNAATSETNAATSETNAQTAQTNAETAETNAQTAETNAQTAQTAAEAAQAAAEAVYDSFDDRYLGAKASDPALDNDSNALLDGALYFDTTLNDMKVYDLGNTTWLSFGAAVTSVNAKSGIVVLDPDDLDDASTAHKFVAAGDVTKLGHISVTQAVDLDQMETDIAALANGMVYSGDWDASVGTFPGGGTAQTGAFYYVSVGGTVDGVVFNVGDNIVATTDNASTTVYAANWSQHDQTDAVQSVAGETGTISTAALLTALSLDTSDTPQYAGIEIGHATDTTLARVSAGVASIEGSNILLASGLGSITQAYDADTLKADTADVLTAGFADTPYSAGTKSSGTYTPDEANGNHQYAVNGGAHTLAPPTNNCTMVIQYTNNASAGAITTSGFTLVDGDTITTTDGDDFFFYITKSNGFSLLTVKALQ